MNFCIPTLDISDSCAVLVKNGKVYKKLGDPLKLVEHIAINGIFQVIDIDAALGTGNNKKLLQQICTQYKCYVGGGIRTYENAKDFLNSSAKRVILSTGISEELIKNIPKDRLILALDVDEKFNVLIKGRQEVSQKNFMQYVDEYKNSVEVIAVTFHHKEGLCAGIPYEQIQQINKMFVEKDLGHIRVLIGGGVTSLDDVEKITKLNMIPLIGSALWNGNFTLGDVYANALTNALIKVKPTEEVKLMPTLVQSIHGPILGLVHSTPESIKISSDTRVATFHSYERNKLWIKGASSSSRFKVHTIKFSCKGESVMFIVEGDNFCHLNCESCFGHNDSARGSLKNLQKQISDSMNLDSPKLRYKLNSKILEEATELICSSNRDEIIYETADLLYFVMLLLIKNKIDFTKIEDELIKRRYLCNKERIEPEQKHKDVFKIGISASHGANAFSLAFLQEVFGVTITKVGDERSYKYQCDKKDIMVIPVKPKDIMTLVNKNYIDAIVSYEDIIINNMVEVEKAVFPKGGSKKNVQIVIAGKKGLTLEILREKVKTKKIVIMAEYVKLAHDWVIKQNLGVDRVKIEHVHGSSESYVVNEICDLCVVVSDTGTTLEKNDLIVLDVLVSTNVNLFVHPTKMSKFNALIS